MYRRTAGESIALLDSLLDTSLISFSLSDVEPIEIEIFDVAHKIIGGGEEGDKTIVLKKEQADHSLQYMVAAALLDGQVMPERYLPDRIERRDVQTLLHKITVRPRKEVSDRFPGKIPCRLIVFLRDGRMLIKALRTRDLMQLLARVPFSTDLKVAS